MMHATEVRLQESDGLATLTLDRPDRLNALTPGMVEELIAAVDQVRAGPARALLLRAEGRAFCSGADLSHAAAEEGGSLDGGAVLERLFNPLLLRLVDLPIPIVTAVNGAAVGGGCGYAFAGDIVFAAKSAYFLLPYVRVGLVADVGATWMLPRLVGRARAMGMMLLGERVTAEQAQDWGLIWAAVDDDALAATALETARQLAAGPTVSFGLTRAAVHASASSSLAEALEGEREGQETARRTCDHREGLEAFLAKRLPHFSGH